LTPNPIHKVLSTLRRHSVQHLLMGGQACVFYGAAEFSRDADVALMPAPENLIRLQSALAELRAECIAVPPFEREYLLRGHAVHFRCHHPDAEGIRIDVMSVMRGVAPFEELWARRTTIDLGEDGTYELLSLPDLVKAKKTQRDKDWPMIRRLVEAHYFQNRSTPTDEQVQFWFLESRTPSILTALAGKHPVPASGVAAKRPLILAALAADEAEVARQLDVEEKAERALDSSYWAPLRLELERLRHR